MENNKYKVEINSFGKFTFREFEISNTTVFFGDNESGKTTLFDALLCSFSKPDKTKYFTDIKKRYGNTDVILKPAIMDEDKIPISMYMNIYAIRQSDIFIDISDNNEWQKVIRTSLYNTDIDIDSLIDNVISEKDSNAKGSIKSELKKLNEKYDETKENLDELYFEEKKLTNLLKEATNKRRANNIIKEKYDRQLEDINILKKNIEIEEDIIHRKMYMLILNSIDEYERLQDYIKRNSVYANDKSEFINKTQSEIDEFENNINFLKDKYASLCKSKDAEKPFLDDKQRNKILDKIDKAIIKINDKKNSIYKKNVLIKLLPSMFITTISLALFVFFDNIFYLFGVLSWLIILIPSKKIDYNIKSIKYITDSIPELNLGSDNIENIDELYDTLLIARRNILEIEPEKESIYHEVLERIDYIEKTKYILVEVLSNYGVDNITSYLENFNFYKNTQNDLKNISYRLEEYMKTFSTNSITMLSVEISRLLRELDQKSIPYDGISEEDLFVKKNNYRRKDEDLRQKYDEILSKEKSFLAEESYVEGERSAYPTKIVLLEGQLKSIESDIEKLYKEDNALNILLNMFEEIRSKNNKIFDKLKNESLNIFNKIVGSNRDAKMNNFETKKMEILDKKNNMININMTSSATKASFLFALRLTLMTKIHGKNRAILLDDPFLTFDEKREYDTLLFLKDFSKEYEVPIIFFTKSELTKNKIIEIFEDVTTNKIG